MKKAFILAALLSVAFGAQAQQQKIKKAVAQPAPNNMIQQAQPVQPAQPSNTVRNQSNTQQANPTPAQQNNQQNNPLPPIPADRLN